MMSENKNEKKAGIDSDKIELDDAGRIKELKDEQLDEVAGGMAGAPRASTARGEICRIQTSPKGCSMNM